MLRRILINLFFSINLISIKSSAIPLIKLSPSPPQSSLISSTDFQNLNTSQPYVIQALIGSSSTPYNMAVFLSSSSSFVANCPGFTYICQTSVGCTLGNAAYPTQEFPFFSLSQSSSVRMNISVSSDWNLTELQNDFFALDSSCPSTFTELGVQGGIGFGINSDSQGNYPNFLSSSTFSIYLNPSGTSQLLFGQDLTLGVSTTQYPITLNTNSIDSWFITITHFFISSNKVSTQDMALVFDLTTNYMILPSAQYSSLLGILAVSGISCSTNTLLASCTITSGLLPDLLLETTTANITLPSSLYLLETSTSGVYSLNIVSGSNSPNSTQVFMTSEYEDVAIFGTSFLEYFYTIYQFSTSQPQITIYVAQNGVSPASENVVLYICLAVVLIILSSVIVLKIRRKSKSAAQNESLNASLNVSKASN